MTSYLWIMIAHSFAYLSAKSLCAIRLNTHDVKKGENKNEYVLQH